MNFQGLISCQAISNQALATADLPKRLKLFNWGTNKSSKGPLVVGLYSLATLSDRQAEYGFDRIGIDYEHQSVPAHANFLPPPREYAAYGVPRVIKGEGIFLEDIQWTPSGQDKARNYIDLSPTTLIENGEIAFIHSVALCPQGAVEGLSFYSAIPPVTSEQGFPVGTTGTISDELLEVIWNAFPTIPKTKDPATLLEFLKKHTEKFLFERSEKLETLSATDMLVAKQLGLTPSDMLPLSAKIPSGMSATDILVCKLLGLSQDEFCK